MDAQTAGGWIDTARGIRIVPLRTPTLPPATHTNCVLLGESRLVVVDPGSPYAAEQRRLDRILDRLEAEGREVAAVLLTHHHPDHVGGAEHLARSRGVPLRAHPDCAACLPFAMDEAIAADGEEVAADPDFPLRALLTPGHAPGHLVFHELANNVLIAGDMVAATGTIVIDPELGDMAAYLSSLRSLDALDAAFLIPGHGPPIDAVRATLLHYIAHREEREARIVRALTGQTESISEHDLLLKVYSDVPVHLHYWAGRSLRAHLIKLTREGAVVADRAFAHFRLALHKETHAE